MSNPPVSNKRTFAIISHPDAGKTTLTEKLLPPSDPIADTLTLRFAGLK